MGGVFREVLGGGGCCLLEPKGVTAWLRHLLQTFALRALGTGDAVTQRLVLECAEAAGMGPPLRRLLAAQYLVAPGGLQAAV